MTREEKIINLQKLIMSIKIKNKVNDIPRIYEYAQLLELTDEDVRKSMDRIGL